MFDTFLSRLIGSAFPASGGKPRFVSKDVGRIKLRDHGDGMNTVSITRVTIVPRSKYAPKAGNVPGGLRRKMAREAS